jgi:Lon protease-like protein
LSDSAPLTLERLPLFPLQTVLFPGGWLPLRIFEVRYLDMVRRCHQAGAPFGVVCLTRGQEVITAPSATAAGAAAAPASKEVFASVGVLAHVETLEQPHPGLLHIVCRGSQRFHVTQTDKLKHGLWVADVEVLPADLPASVPDDLSGTVTSLQRLIHTLSTQASNDQQMPVQKPYQWQDAGWVANRWCELLPVDNELKQRLMSLDNPLVRLELVSDLLEKLRLDTAR